MPTELPSVKFMAPNGVIRSRRRSMKRIYNYCVMWFADDSYGQRWVLGTCYSSREEAEQHAAEHCARYGEGKAVAVPAME